LRWLISFLVICLLPQFAFADCDDEARAARLRIVGSGPLHFEMERWSTHFRGSLCGMIDPGRAQKTRSCTGDAQRIHIDNQVWDNDGLGWQGPYLSHWNYQGAVPEMLSAFRFVSARCLGQEVIAGRAVTKYEFVTKTNVAIDVETLFTDAASGVPVRYETRPDGRDGLNTSTTYRYDSTIKIEPPIVDSAKRRDTSVARFLEASAQSDPECRREVLAVLRRGGAAAFDYEIESSAWAGISGFTGRFVPPHSFQRKVHGAPYHGGGTELVAIDDEVWSRRESKGWESDGRMRKVAADSIGSLAPTANNVGSVKCLGPTLVDGRSYMAYEYDLYLETGSAIERDGLRRVLVDPATRLPLRIEHASRFGVSTEIRHYSENVKIARPIVPQPPPIPTVPFEEFRLRLFK
jgi:hypothetical protein